jgi:hypothetical protein
VKPTLQALDVRLVDGVNAELGEAGDVLADVEPVTFGLDLLDPVHPSSLAAALEFAKAQKGRRIPDGDQAPLPRRESPVGLSSEFVGTSRVPWHGPLQNARQSISPSPSSREPDGCSDQLAGSGRPPCPMPRRSPPAHDRRPSVATFSADPAAPPIRT